MLVFHGLGRRELCYVLSGRPGVVLHLEAIVAVGPWFELT